MRSSTGKVFFALLCDYVNQTKKMRDVHFNAWQTNRKSDDRGEFGKVPLVCSSAFIVSKPTQRLAFVFSLSARRFLRPARANFNRDQKTKMSGLGRESFPELRQPLLLDSDNSMPEGRYDDGKKLFISGKKKTELKRHLQLAFRLVVWRLFMNDELSFLFPFSVRSFIMTIFI